MRLNTLPVVTRLCVLMAGLLALTAWLGDIYAVRYTKTLLDLRLREKATFINNFHSDAIAEALLTKDDVRLLQVVSLLENDQEITSVIVLDDKGEVRYHADAEKIGSRITDAMVAKAFETGNGALSTFQNAGGPALLLIAPLKVAGKPRPIGAVRIEMTYKYVEKQIRKTHLNFLMVWLGSLISGWTILTLFAGKWIKKPLEKLQESIQRVNPVILEAALVESPDEFGQINAALNELLHRIKTEWQTQQAAVLSKPDQERMLVDQLTRSFLPGSRLIYADKDNRVLSDSENGSAPSSEDHLLNLITDTNFANLVGTAFQQEGELVRGSVLFQDQSYDAIVLCIPEGQSKTVKTVIALQSQPLKGESSL